MPFHANKLVFNSGTPKDKNGHDSNSSGEKVSSKPWGLHDSYEGFPLATPGESVDKKESTKESAFMNSSDNKQIDSEFSQVFAFHN